MSTPESFAGPTHRQATPLGAAGGVKAEDAFIAIRGLSHHYVRDNGEALLALDNIQLDIPANSFTAIVGTSGCGKSTLLKMLAGLVEPSAGELLLDGRPIKGPDRRRGMVFQQDATFPWMTVAENIAYGPRANGLPRAKCAELARHWGDLVGLAKFANAWPKELSGGMRKRVDIARVYANDPDVLLMDEPFGALDAQTKERMQNELLALWEVARKTVVFVTHDLDEAIFLSDRVVVMSARPGRIQHVEAIDLARPRTPETRLSDPLLVIKRKLWHMLEGS